MSSRLRKKRNQRANRNRQMSSMSTKSILAMSHGPTGCMYGVHSCWEYKDCGDDIWMKTCASFNNDRLCGATYQVFGAELEWIKRTQGNG
jgi:hypothetical protein